MQVYISRFGRFCSADPVEGWPADPQSWNRYAYVRNDPVNLTDPSGQFWGFLIHLFVALFHAIFHALGFLGAHLGHAFGVLGQAQVGTELIQGGLMTSPTGPVISATVWTAEIPIYATSINWAAIAGYAGIGAAAAGGNGVGFLRDTSKGLQKQKLSKPNCQKDLGALHLTADLPFLLVYLCGWAHPPK